MSKGFIIPMLAMSLIIGGAGVGYGVYTKNTSYTKEQYEAHYQEGYDIGCKDSVVLRNQINSYLEKIKELTTEKTTLASENEIYVTRVNALETEKQSLQLSVESLTLINQENETTIANNNAEISRLRNQITILQSSDENKTAQIDSLTSQISSLRTINSQLQKTNEINAVTISNLNNQVVNLNKQISDLSNQMQSNENNVVALQTEINDLKKSLAYYEEYIGTLENGEQVVATFEFNGSVYNVQVVNKGDIVSLVSPASTESIIFNYWMVDGVEIDLSTYPITESTKFVANITKKHQAKFIVDGEEYSLAYYSGNDTLIVPENPVKDGYAFDGWSLNGVDIIEIPTTISQDTTYHAVFTKLHNVTFIYEGEVLNTQSIRNGEFAENVVVENTEYKIFNGWKYNDIVTDVTTISILSETTFIADITYCYDVSFVVDNEVVSSQIIQSNNYAVSPTSPTKEDYKFMGWSLNNSDIVSVDSVKITKNTQFVAVFELSLGAMSWERVSEISESGEAENVFDVGDEINIVFESGEVVTVFILGFNHDKLSDGSGYAGITFGMKNLLKNTYSMNSTLTNDGGWATTEMRNTTLVEIFNQLPSELRALIKTVDKETTIGSASTTLTTTQDKLFLFSEYEIFGSVYNSCAKEGEQYEYYAENGASFNHDNNVTYKKLNNGNGKAENWFLRSPAKAIKTQYINSNQWFAAVYSGGGQQSMAPTGSGGICFGFCI